MPNSPNTCGTRISPRGASLDGAAAKVGAAEAVNRSLPAAPKGLFEEATRRRV